MELYTFSLHQFMMWVVIHTHVCTGIITINQLKNTLNYIFPCTIEITALKVYYYTAIIYKDYSRI